MGAVAVSVGLLLAATVSSRGWSGGILPTELGPNVCRMAAPPLDSTAVCFSASHVHVAESRMPVDPIRLGQVVWRKTGLRLRHVMLFVAAAPFDIQYLYGHMPVSGTPAVPSPGLDRPKYVIVSENTTFVTSPIPRPVQQDSSYTSVINLRCRHLSLGVTTNIGRHAAAEIENVLRRRAGC
jgi:hypothetical protein